MGYIATFFLNRFQTWKEREPRASALGNDAVYFFFPDTFHIEVTPVILIGGVKDL